MEIPKDLKFTENHEWVKVEGGQARTGITFHAQNELGDIVYVELPEVGRQVDKGEDFVVIESVKSVSDVYAPVSGEVVEVNKDLMDSPELINESPYEEGWLAVIEISDDTGINDLMSSGEYESIL